MFVRAAILDLRSAASVAVGVVMIIEEARA
jgi:hypothetical protein